MAAINKASTAQFSTKRNSPLDKEYISVSSDSYDDSSGVAVRTGDFPFIDMAKAATRLKDSVTSVETNARIASQLKKRKIHVGKPPLKDKKTRPAGDTNLEKGAVWSQRAHNAIISYDVDPYDHSDEDLVEYTLEMFRYYNLFVQLDINESDLRSFTEEVKQYYNPENLFHNFKHVWSVMHISFHILIHGADDYLTPLDIFAVMISALCHDLHHPGNNNAFEVATASELSKVSGLAENQVGILEHHHATMAEKLLVDYSKKHNILRGLTTRDKKHFMRQIGFIILGTDMAKHALLLEEAEHYTAPISTETNAAKAVPQSPAPSSSSSATPNSSTTSTTSSPGRSRYSLRSQNKPASSVTPPRRSNGSVSPKLWAIAVTSKGPVDKTCAESRLAFTRVLVHTADIGAQTQSHDVAYGWMKRCYGEFRVQANKEKVLGIMTSPFLHDLQEDHKTFASQFGFIEMTVEPLWRAMTAFLPKLSFALNQLVDNKLHYKRMLDAYHAANPPEPALQNVEKA